MAMRQSALCAGARSEKMQGLIGIVDEAEDKTSAKCWSSCTSMHARRSRLRPAGQGVRTANGIRPGERALPGVRRVSQTVDLASEAFDITDDEAAREAWRTSAGALGPTDSAPSSLLRG
jgi:hypothetical protein